MCRQNDRYRAQSAGAWVDSTTPDEQPEASRDADLSYWSELGMSYQPEWFPLGGTLPCGN